MGGVMSAKAPILGEVITVDVEIGSPGEVVDGTDIGLPGYRIVCLGRQPVTGHSAENNVWHWAGRVIGVPQ